MEELDEKQKEQELKKDAQKMKIVVYALIIVILAFGVFIFFNQKIKPGTYQYQHGAETFDVQQVGTTQDGGITYRIKLFINNEPGAKYIYTRYEPAQTEGVAIDPDVKKDILTKKEAYVAINPNDPGLKGKTTIAALEINNMLDNAYLFKIPVNSAFTEVYSGDENHTIKTCGDVDEDTAVILLQLGEANAVKDEDGCVIIEGSTEDELIRLSDALMFYLMDMIG